MNMEATLKPADVPDTAEVFKDRTRDRTLLPVNLKEAPAAGSNIGDLNDASRHMLARKEQENSPFHEIATIAVPLISHCVLLSA
jgi:hypothetical protein